MHRVLAYITISILVGFAACKRTGEIKVKNNLPRLTIENVFWGETYIGGAMKPGQETEYIEITRADAKLPAEFSIYFSIEADEPQRYYTEEKFVLEKQGQLIIELTDSTVFYEVER